MLKFRSFFLAGAVGFWAVAAAAQTQSTASATPTANEEGQLEEVVVTATRREESLQNVPISVTALTSSDLERKEITDVLTLSQLVPGASAKQTFSPMEITVAIRGVTQLIPSVNADPAIGIYVDGVYNAIDAGSNSAMIDMERVEVLKGPQGTLFGRNTIGGAMNITTAKPTDDFGGYVEADRGNYNAQTYTGVINGPIVRGLLDGRLVYQHNEHNGYGENTHFNVRINTLHEDYVRGSLKLDPADGWEVLGSAFFHRGHGYDPL